MASGLEIIQDSLEQALPHIRDFAVISKAYDNFGSGRALPPFPPLRDHPIFSTVSGVMGLSVLQRPVGNGRV
jgi:hypothetical protein